MRKILMVAFILVLAGVGCALMQPSKPAARAAASGQLPGRESLADRYTRAARELNDQREAGMRAVPYQVGRLDALLDQLAVARDAGDTAGFARLEEAMAPLFDTLRVELAAGGGTAAMEAGVVSRQAWETRIRSLKEEVERYRLKNGALRNELAQAELTVRELKSQLGDAQASAAEIIENIQKYSTKQVAAMHAEAKVMVQRMETVKSAAAVELAGYARGHLHEGEAQLKKENSAGAAFYFSQISGIYSRFQKLSQK